MARPVPLRLALSSLWTSELRARSLGQLFLAQTAPDVKAGDVELTVTYIPDGGESELELVVKPEEPTVTAADVVEAEVGEGTPQA